MCIAEKVEELKATQGYRTSDPFDISLIALLAALVAVANVLAVLGCMHKIATDEKWRREWSTVGAYSDVMLCFRINKEYARGQSRGTLRSQSSSRKLPQAPLLPSSAVHLQC